MAIFTSIIKKIQFNFDSKLNDITFVQQTASLSVRVEQTNQGNLTKYSLSFKMTPISPENDILANKMINTRQLSITDFHNYVTAIGRDEYPPKISIAKETTGTAGGFRGYTINVEWSYIN